MNYFPRYLYLPWTHASCFQFWRESRVGSLFALVQVLASSKYYFWRQRWSAVYFLDRSKVTGILGSRALPLSSSLILSALRWPRPSPRSPRFLSWFLPTQLLTLRPSNSKRSVPLELSQELWGCHRTGLWWGLLKKIHGFWGFCLTTSLNPCHSQLLAFSVSDPV